MALIIIPTRTASNVNAAADINDLMTDIQTLIDDYIQPIGSTYIQVPTTGANGKSNTKTTAFPTAEEPGNLYGGTWTQLFEDEGVFLKTEGDALSQTNGENNARSNGLQTDAFQGSSPVTAAGNLQIINVGVNISSPTNVALAADYGSVVRAITNAGNDGTNGTPRTGKETRPRNRLMKIWKRTA